MTSPASPLLDESPLPPSPRRPAGPLTFRPPAEDETTSPWTPGEGTSLDDPLAGSPSGSDELPDLDEPDESGPRSSRASSADPSSVRPLSSKAQRLAARQAVKIAGSMAHQALARDDAAKAAGLFLVPDEIAAEIADPLARIMARRAPLDGAIANPDVADGIAAMLGVAHFVSVTIEAGQHAAAYRQHNAAAAAGQMDPQDV